MFVTLLRTRGILPYVAETVAATHLAVMRATAPAGRQRNSKTIATTDRRRRFVLPAMKGGAASSAPTKPRRRVLRVKWFPVANFAVMRATAPAGRRRYGRIIATADRRRRFILPAMKRGAASSAPTKPRRRVLRVKWFPVANFDAASLRKSSSGTAGHPRIIAFCLRGERGATKACVMGVTYAASARSQNCNEREVSYVLPF